MILSFQYCSSERARLYEFWVRGCCSSFTRLVEYTVFSGFFPVEFKSWILSGKTWQDRLGSLHLFFSRNKSNLFSSTVFTFNTHLWLDADWTPRSVLHLRMNYAWRISDDACLPGMNIQYLLASFLWSFDHVSYTIRGDMANTLDITTHFCEMIT